MRRTTTLVLLAAALAIGCARIQPAWDDIPGSDLAGRHSFRIDTATPPADLGPDERRTWEDQRTLVRGLIREDLAAKGYRETINDPDFVVRFWGKRGASYAEEHHYAEQKGSLDIRAVDPETGAWLWHGWASETITRGFDADEEIRRAVAAILERFPTSAAALR